MEMKKKSNGAVFLALSRFAVLGKKMNSKWGGGAACERDIGEGEMCFGWLNEFRVLTNGWALTEIRTWAKVDQTNGLKLVLLTS